MRCHPHNARTRFRTRGLSLLELIGVLAIIGIFAVFLFRSLIRETDAEVARKERAALRQYGEALKRGIMKTSVVPDWNVANSGNWAALVGGQVGLDTINVYLNSRNQPRVMVIDTNGWFGRTTLPYVQNGAGSPTPPDSARVMLVSSLGQSLPIGLRYGGAIDSGAFAALWNAQGASFMTNSAWTGWDGRAEDILVERVHLTPLFLTVYFATQSSATNGLYNVGSDPTNYVAPVVRLSGTNLPQQRFYLQGTTLGLRFGDYGGTNTLSGMLDSRHILNNDASFLYELDVWKSSAAGGILPGGVDIASVVKAFLQAPYNMNAPNTDMQQLIIVEKMMDYMRNYIAWAERGFDKNDALYSTLQNVNHRQMIDAVRQIYEKSAGYFPVNTGGCQ